MWNTDQTNQTMKTTNISKNYKVQTEIQYAIVISKRSFAKWLTAIKVDNVHRGIGELMN